VIDPLPDWATFGLAEDVRPAMRAAQAAGEAFVLGTLISVEGGGPRPEGTQMVFAPGVLAGYFSGGCVEGDVAGHAWGCLEDGQPRTLVYGEGSPWPDIRLLCGARIEIFLERVGRDDAALAEILAAEAERRPVTYVSDGFSRECAPDLSPWPEAAVYREYEPAPRLVVIGGDPTALAIAELGVKSGFETTLVRPKGPATPPPIDGVAYRRDEPGEALHAIGLDPWTSVAVATHDLETDREALKAALPSRAAYVGLLGARRRLAGRIEELRAGGMGATALERLHAPIGLDIGGKAPFEVAVSVIGEITALRYARASGSTSTTSPAAAGGASIDLRSKASETAKTLTSEES
jgi:xanthine dehydrogenase accessory factor